ncbi:MAG: hypothetical protein A3A83_02170 [Candidatus Doudnabacteria bacterium RIFCSPLOWO2_01_FULL_48_57]|nr:MAG: hypothetical protein A3A83_02170 [Candidatus Doudnabacteria bacterium RIFCSPLOWO2_01_FULL_48_57]
MAKIETIIKPNYLKQHSELTHKFNLHHGRHGWLRLTPAYSVKLVDQLLKNYDTDKVILDPFSGTGTTPLCAASKGYTVFGVEFNPFLVWLSEAKLANYSITNESLIDIAKKIRYLVEQKKIEPINAPNIFNINRWWAKDSLEQLCRIKAGIEKCTDIGSDMRTLLDIAFCRTMISVSNASFNHQSMSFQNQKATLYDNLLPSKFCDDVNYIMSSAVSHILINNDKARIIRGDSKSIQNFLPSKVDIVITSPPYPNRMSYVRELRPYLYWLGYIKEAREAGNLDWDTIGGTWGIATSRLNDWGVNSNEIFYPDDFLKIIEKIKKADGKNALLLSKYLSKYFADIWLHLQSLIKVLQPNAEVHYIVGNVSFYGNLVPVEQIYAGMMKELGFSKVEIITLRKRNSNRHLFEFDVHGSL